MKKVTRRFILVVVIVMLMGFIVLTGFYLNSYTALDEQFDELSVLEMEDITYHVDGDEISFKVEDPIKNIVFVPGGLVNPDAYTYLALGLAKEGYDVTISKALFNLAIFTPNKANKFLRDDLENVVIGHSLGGVTASLMASDNQLVSEVIFLGSYPIADLTDKEVFIILAEHDLGMDLEKVNQSLEYTSNETVFMIEGGNHAQFGWYGPQRGDGEAEIPTLEQQQITIRKIIEYIA